MMYKNPDCPNFIEQKEGDGTTRLSLVLADAAGLRWSQAQVTQHHYLHTPVDVRCRPLAYLVMLFEQPMGCLIFGRPEATKVTGWYGSVEDVQAGLCAYTRWQILNLARVYLDTRIQRGGEFADSHILPGFYDRRRIWRSTAASYVIDLALERIAFEYLYHRPPVWMDQPYELAHIISYCDTRFHKGTIYRSAHFERVRVNGQGIETYRRATRPLTHAEHAALAKRSREDRRAQRLRALVATSHIKQLSLMSVLESAV